MPEEFVQSGPCSLQDFAAKEQKKGPQLERPGNNHFLGQQAGPATLPLLLLLFHVAPDKYRNPEV